MSDDTEERQPSMNEFFSDDLDQWHMMARVCIAAACGAAIGFEREFKGHVNACVRMHMLVGAGAATYVAASVLNTVDTRQGDPSRIAAGIVSGVGFLAGATIFKDGNTVAGVNTAAGVWMVAAIGVAAGYGYYVIAGLTTALTLVIQHGVFFFLSPKFWRSVWKFLKGASTRTDASQEDSYELQDKNKQEKQVDDM